MTKKELIELLEQYEDNVQLNISDPEGAEYIIDTLDTSRDRYSGEWTLVIKIKNS